MSLLEVYNKREEKKIAGLDKVKFDDGPYSQGRIRFNEH